MHAPTPTYLAMLHVCYCWCCNATAATDVARHARCESYTAWFTFALTIRTFQWPGVAKDAPRAQVIRPHHLPQDAVGGTTRRGHCHDIHIIPGTRQDKRQSSSTVDMFKGMSNRMLSCIASLKQLKNLQPWLHSVRTWRLVQKVLQRMADPLLT